MSDENDYGRIVERAVDGWDAFINAPDPYAAADAMKNLAPIMVSLRKWVAKRAPQGRRGHRAGRDDYLRWVLTTPPTEIADRLYNRRRDLRHFKAKVTNLTRDVKAIATQRRSLQEKVDYLEHKILSEAQAVQAAHEAENWNLVGMHVTGMFGITDPIANPGSPYDDELHL